MFTIPSQQELGPKLQKVFPIGTGWRGLSYQLAEQEGTEIDENGILLWIVRGLAEQGMLIAVQLTIPRIIEEVVTDENLKAKALEIFQEVLQEMKDQQEEEEV